MKFEEIKMGDVFRYQNDEETVISKNDRYRIITTIDSDTIPTAWEEDELHLLEPIKEELPEEGLLVSLKGSLVYKLSDGSGYGFLFGEQSNYTFNKSWNFYNVDYWKPATPEQKEQFIEMLWKECEKRGLYEDTELNNDALKSKNSGVESNKRGMFPEVKTGKVISNVNGIIFYKGKFATPLKEKSAKVLVVDLNNYTTETTESGVIILTPLKKQYK